MTRGRILAWMAAASLLFSPRVHAQQPTITEILRDYTTQSDGAYEPADLAFDSGGNLYVIMDSEVLKVSAFGEVSIFFELSGGGGSALAVDSDDNIYACASVGGKVYKISPSGFGTVFVQEPDIMGIPLDRPIDVELDGAGNVYIAGEWSDNVIQVRPDGQATEIIDWMGDGFINQWGIYQGNYLDFPVSLAVDSLGSVYVASSSSDNVFRVASNGTITRVLGPAGDGSGNPLDLPYRLVVDGNDNLLVTGTNSNNAFRVTPSGMVTEIIDSTGDGTNGLAWAFGIAADAFGAVYVSGRSSNNVFRISAAGGVTQIIDTVAAGGSQLHRPQALAVDRDGNSYVAGHISNNVFKIGGPVPPASFCGSQDVNCPCSGGVPNAGCNIPIPPMQGGGTTGGIALTLVAQHHVPANRATLSASGFPQFSNPSGILIRSSTLHPSGPMVFGDGIRCVGTPVVRIGASVALDGTSVHTIGHGAVAGFGIFHYQLWFRSTPASFCDPTASFNLSNGRSLLW